MERVTFESISSLIIFHFTQQLASAELCATSKYEVVVVGYLIYISRFTTNTNLSYIILDVVRSRQEVVVS